jgi:hypothetical protein
MSLLSSKLAKLEKALKPPSRMFSVTRTVIISLNGPSKHLPIANAEVDRLKADGYREGVDSLVEILEFALEDGLDLAELGLAR